MKTRRSRLYFRLSQKTALRGEWHKEWSPLPFDAQVQAALGERTALFYLLAYLAALPYAEKEYRRRGIPAKIFDDTMSDIRRYLLVVYDLEGRWGFREFMWIWHHLTCELFRLGRLQFRLAPFEGKVTAFRKKDDRRYPAAGRPAHETAPGWVCPRRRADQSGRPIHLGGAGRRSLPAEGGAWLPAFEESKPAGEGTRFRRMGTC